MIKERFALGVPFRRSKQLALLGKRSKRKDKEKPYLKEHFFHQLELWSQIESAVERKEWPGASEAIAGEFELHHSVYYVWLESTNARIRVPHHLEHGT